MRIPMPNPEAGLENVDHIVIGEQTAPGALDTRQQDLHPHRLLQCMRASTAHCHAEGSAVAWRGCAVPMMPWAHVAGAEARMSCLAKAGPNKVHLQNLEEGDVVRNNIR